MNDHHHQDPVSADFDWNDVYTGDEADFMPPDPLVLELALQLEPGHVLDVGCGAGGLLAALASRGWQTAGVDVADKAIAAAKKVLAKRGVEAELLVADASTWRPSRTYDLVTNCFALPMKHAQQVEVYGTIKAAVAPGGTVIIKDFDPQMAKVDAFGDCDLVRVEDLVAAFDGFEVLRAEVVPTLEHDHGQSTYGKETWTAALLVARRPPA